MSSEHLVIALVVLGGCADNTVIVDVPARATFDVMLGPTDAEPLRDETGYRWELVEAPDASHAESPVGESTVTFRPDIRGIYLVERWIVYGLSERLSHRFVIAADGVPPTAAATSSMAATVGSAVALSGASSSSVEMRDLVYRWRLTQRPRDSIAVLTTPDEVTASFTPDMAGVFGIELAVFDGDLWSTMPATLAIQVATP